MGGVGIQNCGPSAGFQIPTLSRSDDTKRSAGLIAREKYWNPAKQSERCFFYLHTGEKTLHRAAPGISGAS